MKNKKLFLIIFVILAVLLIGAGTIYSIYSDQSKEKPEEKEKITIEPNKDAEESKVSELKSIISPDKKIRLGSTKIYKSENIYGMMLNIIPYEDFDKVYIEILLELPTANDEIIICLENLTKNKPIEYETQSFNDWSNAKSWSVKIISEQEAVNKGYVKAEE